MQEHIKANAEMVVRELRALSGIDFGYTRESVQWLEGYIERLRVSGEFDDVEMKDRLVSVFGSFLGECVIHCYGGMWDQHDGGLCVTFSNGIKAFPLNKVAKQLDNGLGDGISSFFTLIPVLLEDRSEPQVAVTRKPWWRFW